MTTHPLHLLADWIEAERACDGTREASVLAVQARSALLQLDPTQLRAQAGAEQPAAPDTLVPAEVEREIKGLRVKVPVLRDTENGEVFFKPDVTRLLCNVAEALEAQAAPLADLEARLEAAEARAAALERAAVTLHGWSRRYCDGRSTYAPSEHNEATHALLKLGIHLPTDPISRSGPFAIDGGLGLGQKEQAWLAKQEQP